MAALNSTEVSMLARDYVLLLTDTNARIGKTGEERGRWRSRQLTVGAYGRDLLKVNAILRNKKTTFMIYIF